MARFMEKLNSLVVTATSPDGNIKSRLVGGENLTLAFRPGSYRDYSETVLADQLAKLGILTWTTYHRGWLKALGEVNGEKYTKKPQHWNANHRRYDEAIAEAVTQGTSPSGRIEMRAKGLAFWKVRVADGTVEELEEQHFTEEAVAAFRNVQLDMKRQMILFKEKYIGLTLPASWKAKLPI